MPRISEFYGIVIYMYYSDHAPPHFHAVYGQFEAAILIRSAAVTKGHLPRRALSLVREWAAKYREELEQNWERAVAHEELRMIPALD
jgi:hypothetical protein